MQLPDFLSHNPLQPCVGHIDCPTLTMYQPHSAIELDIFPVHNEHKGIPRLRYSRWAVYQPPVA